MIKINRYYILYIIINYQNKKQNGCVEELKSNIFPMT